MFSKMSNTFLSYDAVNPSNQDSAFPWTRVEDIDHPRRSYRSTITTEVTLVIDMLTNQTTVTVYLENVNFTSVDLGYGASDSGPFTNLGTFTIEKDPAHGVYRRKFEVDMVSNRYLEVKITAQTPVDGAAYFEIGSIAVPETIQNFDENLFVTYPFVVSELNEGVIQNIFDDGSIESSSISKLKAYGFTMNILAAVEHNISGSDFEKIMDLIRDSTSNIWVDFNLGETWQSYIVKRNSRITATLQAPRTGTVRLNNLLFRINI